MIARAGLKACATAEGRPECSATGEGRPGGLCYGRRHGQDLTACATEDDQRSPSTALRGTRAVRLGGRGGSILTTCPLAPCCPFPPFCPLAPADAFALL